MRWLEKSYHLTGHNAAVYALTPGSAPATFLTGSGDGWIVAWQPARSPDGRLVAQTEERIFALLTLAPDHYVAGGMDGSLFWIENGTPRRIRHHRSAVFGLIQWMDQLFSVGGDGYLTRWSISEKRPKESLQLSQRPLRCIFHLPAENRLAIGSSDGGIYLVHPERMTLEMHLPEAHASSVFALTASESRQRLYSGGRDARLFARDLYDLTAPVDGIPAHWFTINDLALHPSLPLLASASRDKTVKLWHAETLELLQVLETIRDRGHINSVNRLIWLDETTLLSTGDDRSVIGWGLKENQI